MDELEFRRRAITHPTDRDPAFSSRRGVTANRKHLDEMKQLDRSLQRALEVEVPAGLAEDPAQAGDGSRSTAGGPAARPRGSGLARSAMAASVAFLLGMSTRWISWPCGTGHPVAGPGRHGPRLWESPSFMRWMSGSACTPSTPRWRNMAPP
jgi:hypothetical protein